MANKNGSSASLGTDTPYETADGLEAVSLYFSGAQLVEDGMWCTNTYTRTGLQKMGFTGMRMAEAAFAAVKSSKAGIIRYLFRSRPDRELSFVNEQIKELRENDIEAVSKFDELIDRLVSGEIDREEFKARSASLILTTRREVMNAWKHVVPLLEIEDDGPVRRFNTTARTMDKDGRAITVAAKAVERPGFKIISANASEATQKRLKIRL